MGQVLHMQTNQNKTTSFKCRASRLADPRLSFHFPAGPSIQQIVYADSAGGIKGESKLSRTNSDQIAEGSRMPYRRRLNGCNEREEEKSFQFHAQAQSDSSSISGRPSEPVHRQDFKCRQFFAAKMTYSRWRNAKLVGKVKSWNSFLVPLPTQRDKLDLKSRSRFKVIMSENVQTRILIVDDEPYNLMGLKIVLQQAEKELLKEIWKERLASQRARAHLVSQDKHEPKSTIFTLIDQVSNGLEAYNAFRDAYFNGKIRYSLVWFSWTAACQSWMVTRQRQRSASSSWGIGRINLESSRVPPTQNQITSRTPSLVPGSTSTAFPDFRRHGWSSRKTK